MCSTHPSHPPKRFNLAAYCLSAAADPARRDAPALRVVHGVEGLAALENTTGERSDAVERWTYAELADAVSAVAAGLRAAGLRRGDRVMIRLGNTTDYALAHFGAMAAGLVSLPSSDQLTDAEAAFLLADSGAAALVHGPDAGLPTHPGTAQETLPATGARTGPEGPEGLLRFTPADLRAWWSGPDRLDLTQAERETDPEDPAFLVYTSGTTSRPKGVLHAHRSAWGRRPMYDGWYGITADDVMLHAGAFNWTYTLGVGLTDPWANGACAAVYVGERDRTLWPRLITATGATMFAAVPGVYRQTIAADDGTGALGRLREAGFRHGLVAGEALPQATREAWEAATGTPLFESLGMSEISTFVSSSPTVPVRPGSPGKAQPGRRIAVLDPVTREELAVGERGLLAVHRDDPGLMLGYWQRPDLDPYAGDWFVTSDLVALDAEGYLTYHGRADDVITAGGYRVGPDEVEAVLSRADGVTEVAVTALEVRPDVHVVAAFVVPAPGVGEEEVEAQVTEVAQDLAAYKRPRRVVVVDGLPRTRNGKLRRKDLGR